MTALLPHSKVFYGDTQALALHEAKRAWPYVQYAPGVFIIYNHHMVYDHPVYYDGLMPRIDLSPTVYGTRDTPGVSADVTRRRATVSVTRSAQEIGPTRIGRRIARSEATRVIRKLYWAVQDTRQARVVQDTRNRGVVSPTRMKRGK
jgi:hypothetical protein